MDTCVCIAESLPCSPETITTLLIGYTPIQKIVEELEEILKKSLRRHVESFVVFVATRLI